MKRKKNLDKINQLINSLESANKKQKDEVLLAQLVIKRQKKSGRDRLFAQ